MQKLCTAGVGLGLLLMVVPCLGAEAKLNGSVLLRACSQFLASIDTSTPSTATQRDLLDQGMCYGLVDGILTTSIYYELEHSPKAICLPRNMEQVQGMRIIVAYLKTHPEEIQANAAFVAITALRQAFPCPRP